MSGALLAALLGTGGLGAIVAAIVTGLFSKRKLGAEATEIITKAAAGVVTNLQDELQRQVRRNEVLVNDHRSAVASLVDSHEKELAEVRRVMRLHAAWDLMAISRLADQGISLPKPPDLTHLGLGEDDAG